MSTATTTQDPEVDNGAGDRFASTVDQAQRFWRTWVEFAVKTGASAAPPFDPDADANDFARNYRKLAFDAMSQSAHQLMRSPQFLELMKGWLDLSVKSRRQISEMLTDAHHNVEGVAREDLSNLHLSLRHVEQRTAELVEQIGERLEAIDRRLERLEQTSQRTQSADDAAVDPGNGESDSANTGAGHVQ